MIRDHKYIINIHKHIFLILKAIRFGGWLVPYVWVS